MPIVLYSNPLSPPGRAVKTVLLLTNTQFEEKIIDISKGENKTPEYQKINPDEGIPTLQDGAFCLPESGAIIKYVARNSEALYPKDPKKKAKIDSYLDFHASSMFIVPQFAMDFVLGPGLFKKPEPANKEQRFKDLEETLIWFEEIFLGGGKFKYIFDSQQPTIADIKAAIELQALFIINYDFSKVPNLKTYVERMSKLAEIEQVSQEFYGFILGVLKIQLNPFLQTLVKLKQQPLQQKAQPQLLVAYHQPLSPYSRAALSVILGQKIDHQITIIDVIDQTKNPKEFFNVSPNQTVPAISQGQYNLFESHAIMRYLCDAYNIKDLYPKTNFKHRAKVDEYLDWHQSDGAFGELLRFSLDYFFLPTLLKKPEAPNKQQRLQQIDELLAFFIQTFLGNGKYKYINNLPNITLADLSAASQLSMLFTVNYDFEKFPLLKQYVSVVFADYGIKEANKEYFGFIQSNKLPLNPFIQSVIKPNRKSGCC